MHFPIAFLVAYSVIKIFPLDRFFPSVSWRQIERVLLVLGLAGASLSLVTGETAEHLTKASHKIVESHSFFAGLATFLYGVLLFGEILAFINMIAVTSSQFVFLR